ncbi:MAG TPA: hypothetical protein ENF77_04510 [Candidatus Acetothermia bacterium]|nr:hypothetical protein [Candidatus Acetothermia bacterium]
MEVGRIRRKELPYALALWRANFSADWDLRGTDIQAVARLFSLLLSCRRLPLSLLQRLGVRAEIWVLRDKGKVVGVLGQIGYRIPYLLGLVMERGARGLARVKWFLDGVCQALAEDGFRFARALVPQQHPVVKLVLRLGWEVLGEVHEYVVELHPLPKKPPLEIPVERLRAREEEQLARTALAAADIRTLLSLERNYGSKVARLLGFRDLFLAPRSGGREIVAVSANRYQRMATVRSFNRGEIVPLLERALDILRSWGKERAQIGLLDPAPEVRCHVEGQGGNPQGVWLQLVKDLTR